MATGRPYLTYVDYRPLKVSVLDEPPVTTENAYAALLAIAHVAFYVVAWTENEPNLDGLRPFENSMLRLWPIQARTITFPPNGPRLDQSALDEFADGPFGTADRSKRAVG